MGIDICFNVWYNVEKKSCKRGFVMRKNPLDFVVIVIGIILMVIRFNGGAEFMSYIGVVLILVGLFSPPKTTKCKYCKSEKNIDAVVCPQCGKRQGVSMGAVVAGIVLFAIWIFIEVCMI